MSVSDQNAIRLVNYLNRRRYKFDFNRFQIGTCFFILFFIVIPFDNYIGTVLKFPLLTVIYFLYIIVALKDIWNYGLGKTRFDIVSAYLLFTFISILYTVFRTGLSYNNLLFIEMLLFFLVFKNRKYSIKEYAAIINLTPLIMVFYILLNVLYIKNTDIGIYAGLKSIVDANYLVTNMALVLALFCFSLQTEKQRLIKVLKYIILALYFVIIAIIGSRGGLFTSILIVAVYLITQSKRPLRSFIILLCISVFAILLAVSFLPDYILQRFTLENMIGGGGSGRVTIWKNYILLFKRQNLFGQLFGIGKDLGGTAYLEFGRVYYAHNMYIRALLETGIVGLILLLGMILYLLYKAYREKNGVLFAAICGFAFGAIFLDMDNMRVFWLILALSKIQIKEGKILVWRGRIKVI